MPPPSPQAASPACTELETVMLDWLGKMLQLPDAFLAEKAGAGGGVIQVRRGGAGRLLDTGSRGSATGAGLGLGLPLVFLLEEATLSRQEHGAWRARGAVSRSRRPCA